MYSPVLFPPFVIISLLFHLLEEHDVLACLHAVENVLKFTHSPTHPSIHPLYYHRIQSNSIHVYLHIHPNHQANRLTSRPTKQHALPRPRHIPRRAPARQHPQRQRDQHRQRRIVLAAGLGALRRTTVPKSADDIPALGQVGRGDRAESDPAEPVPGHRGGTSQRRHHGLGTRGRRAAGDGGRAALCSRWWWWWWWWWNGRDERRW